MAVSAKKIISKNLQRVLLIRIFYKKRAIFNTNLFDASGSLINKGSQGIYFFS
jgi:hypothetical protein